MAGTTEKLSKSDFIRARADKTAAEIVAEARSLGIQMNANYVYVVRGNDKGRGDGGAAATGGAAARSSAAAKGKTAAPGAKTKGQDLEQSPEDMLRRAVRKLGTNRAREIVDEMDSE